jgi:hypothetical protein
MTSILCDIPCKTCIVYAACRSKPLIKCSILYNHFRLECPRSLTETQTSTQARGIKEQFILNDYMVFLDKFETAIHDGDKVICVYD